jgi:hypothetical protein
LYLMIGPSGAALSLDRLIYRWWATYRALRRDNPADGVAAGPARLPALDVRPSVSANLAIRLLQIHVCIIYLAAGLSKLQGRAWWTGEAIWGTLANFEFAPMQYPAYNAFLMFLSKYRLFWELFMTVGTLFTLTFEIGFAFLVWNRYTRWMMLAMAVTLHGGIGLFMGLKTFSLMMLCLVLAFVSPELIRRLLRAISRGPSGMRLYFPAWARPSVRAASLVHALDVYNQVELVDENAGWNAPEPKAGARGAGPAGGGTATAVKAAPPASAREATPEGEGLRLVTARGDVRTGLGLAFYLLGALGIFRTFYPWSWFGALRRPAGPGHPDAPRSLQAVLAEPVSLRTPAEVVKAGGPHVKPKR